MIGAPRAALLLEMQRTNHMCHLAGYASFGVIVLNPKAKHCSPMPMRPTSCTPAPISTPLKASSVRSIPHSRVLNRLADEAAHEAIRIQDRTRADQRPNSIVLAKLAALH